MPINAARHSSETPEILRLLDGMDRQKRSQVLDLLGKLADGPTPRQVLQTGRTTGVRSASRAGSKPAKALLINDKNGDGFIHITQIGDVPAAALKNALARGLVLTDPTGQIIGVKVGRLTRL